MSGFNIGEMLQGRSSSAISELLTDPPKLVSLDNVPPAPAVEEAETPAPLLPNPFGTPAKPPVVDADDDDEPYIPLTAEEMRAKAESKADMWAAVIALGVSILNRFILLQQIRKGDKELIADYEREFKRTKSVPVYPPEHPYHDARERYDQFENALKEAEEEAVLSKGQLDLLKRAIEANLKAKNKRGKLRTAGVGETLLEIMLVKAMEPLMGLGMVAVNKMTDKAFGR